MDLIGLPWQLAIGPRGAASGKVELKKRGAAGAAEELAVDAVIARLGASSSR